MTSGGVEPGSGKSVELVEAGSELAGAAVGGAIGLIAGPPGAIGGAVAGVLATRTLRRIGEELHDRLLGPRQRVRLGAAFAFAADEIAARIESGEAPRQDWFAPGDEGTRPKAEELLEGTLLEAASAYEERKVRHIGWFYASLAFEPRIGPGYANLMLRIIDRLTYRGLVGTALFYSDRYRIAFAEIDRAREEGNYRATGAVIAQLDELGNAGILGVQQEGLNPPASIHAVYGGGSFLTIALSRVTTTQLGDDLFELMRLDRVPASDLKDMLLELGASAESLAAEQDDE